MIRTHARLARLPRRVVALGVLVTPAALWGAVSEQEAAQLGRTLTPVGAEKAANKDGF